MTLYTYSSNNSGGSWWLSDEDWYALEAAGWKVDWYRDRESSIFGGADASGRWLGALASSASKEFSSYDEAAAEWEGITGQSLDEEGCECCGAPHYIY
jgi:hypothetical protein